MAAEITIIDKLCEFPKHRCGTRREKYQQNMGERMKGAQQLESRTIDRRAMKEKRNHHPAQKMHRNVDPWKNSVGIEYPRHHNMQAEDGDRHPACF